MRAIVYPEPEKFDVVEVPTPSPGPGQVLLKVLMTGVCGTDLHLHVGEFGPAYPLTPGHEMVLQVVGLGEGVTSWREGQQVTLDNMISCHVCPDCRRGFTVFCEHTLAQGVNVQGGFAEYIVADEGQLYDADDLEVDRAVFAEPLSCVVHGIDAIAQPPGSNALVIGAGPTGLLLAQLLKANGGARVTLAAPTQFKLDLAAGWGLDTLLLDRDDPAGSVAAMRERCPEGYDVVADATGRVSVLDQAMQVVRDAGTIAVYGMAGEKDRWSVSPYDIFRRELRIQGSFAQSGEFDRTMRWLRSDALQTEGMITHRLGLEEYAEALEACGSSACLKAVIVP